MTEENEKFGRRNHDEVILRALGNLEGTQKFIVQRLDEVGSKLDNVDVKVEKAIEPVHIKVENNTKEIKTINRKINFFSGGVATVSFLAGYLSDTFKNLFN